MIVEPIRPEHRDAFHALLQAFSQHANNPSPGNDAFEESFAWATGCSSRRCDPGRSGHKRTTSYGKGVSGGASPARIHNWLA